MDTSETSALGPSEIELHYYRRQQILNELKARVFEAATELNLKKKKRDALRKKLENAREVLKKMAFIYQGLFHDSCTAVNISTVTTVQSPPRRKRKDGSDKGNDLGFISKRKKVDSPHLGRAVKTAPAEVSENGIENIDLQVEKRQSIQVNGQAKQIAHVLIKTSKSYPKDRLSGSSPIVNINKIPDDVLRSHVKKMEEYYSDCSRNVSASSNDMMTFLSFLDLRCRNSTNKTIVSTPLRRKTRSTLRQTSTPLTELEDIVPESPNASNVSFAPSMLRLPASKDPIVLLSDSSSSKSSTNTSDTFSENESNDRSAKFVAKRKLPPRKLSDTSPSMRSSRKEVLVKPEEVPKKRTPRPKRAAKPNGLKECSLRTKMRRS